MMIPEPRRSNRGVTLPPTPSARAKVSESGTTVATSNSELPTRATGTIPLLLGLTGFGQLSGLMSRFATVGATAHENTYADPQLSPAAQATLGAATTAVSPLTETEDPKMSPAAALEAVSFCSSSQEVPSKRNTYAAPQSSPAAQPLDTAPTTTISPLTETDAPNPSPGSASDAVSFCSSTQEVRLNRKTYAAPQPNFGAQSARAAPTMTVSPFTETEPPKKSALPASEAVSFCSRAQLVPLKRKICAEPQSRPAAQSSLNAPTTAVSPLTETEFPNQAEDAASEAVSFCSSTQSVPLYLNTYADPHLRPAVHSSPGAPTTAVSPLTDTEYPNRSLSAPSDAVSFCLLNQ